MLQFAIKTQVIKHFGLKSLKINYDIHQADISLTKLTIELGPNLEVCRYIVSSCLFSKAKASGKIYQTLVKMSFDRQSY